MSQDQSAETIPAEHEEDICSGGQTMCHECYDSADVATEEA